MIDLNVQVKLNLITKLKKKNRIRRETLLKIWK